MTRIEALGLNRQINGLIKFRTRVKGKKIKQKSTNAEFSWWRRKPGRKRSVVISLDLCPKIWVGRYWWRIIAMLNRLYVNLQCYRQGERMIRHHLSLFFFIINWNNKQEKKQKRTAIHIIVLVMVSFNSIKLKYVK